MRQRGRKSAAALAVVGTKPHLVATNPATSLPQPPKHLGDVERAIWANVVAEYQGSLTSLSVLATGLEAHQRAREARETIEDEGMVVSGRDGQTKAHPLLTVERDARKAFQQTFRYLGIKDLMERKHHTLRDIGPYKRYELLTGEIIYTQDDGYSGYGDGVGKDLRAFISDQMKADWHVNRTALIAFWKSKKNFGVGDTPPSPPWLTCYEFDRDAPPWAARVLDGKTEEDTDHV